MIHAQQNVPAVEQRLDSIENKLKESNYVRVPQKDFDEILDAKVSRAAKDEVQGWVWIIVTFFGALMTLLTFWLNRKMKDEVAEKIELKSKNIEQSIETISKGQLEIIKKVSILDEKVANTMDMFWDEMALMILDKARDKKNLDAEFEKKIHHFLKYEHVTLSEQRQIQLIDALMRSYYYSADEDSKYKKMVKLIREYENKFNLEPQTYANAAIAHSNIYELYGHESDRNNSLDNCEKSILRKKDYGIPYTVKMEIFLIDHEKAIDQLKKNEAIQNLKQTFKSIENNQSNIIAVEVIERMNIDRSIDYLKPYYNKLEQLFPFELNKIRLRAVEYYLKNYAITAANDKEYAMLDSILAQASASKPIDINGKWKVVKIMNAGVPEAPGAVDEIFEVTDYTYFSNGDFGKGCIFYLNAGPVNNLIFFKNLGNNQFQKIPAIYGIDLGELQICYDWYQAGIPQTFSTDATNKYIALSLEPVPVLAEPTVAAVNN
jgi:hypothetical protein